MANTINQLLVQSQAAHDASDWPSLIQYLQQLILEEDSQHPEIAENQEYLLKLALSILEQGDFQQRWETTKVLLSLGNISIPPLIDILGDEEAEEELRWYAARTLGEFPHPDAILPLGELLKSNKNEELKEIAATALGQMGPIAIDVLSELLKQDETRFLAVRSLSHIRRSETIVPLLSVVDDSQAEIRAAALEALSSFYDKRVPPVLLNALNDPSPIVRNAAVLGLGFRPDLQSTLDLVTKLQPILYDQNLEVCCAAVFALSRMGGDIVSHHLSQVLMSPSTVVDLQLEIIRALSWLGTTTSLEYLRQALNQSSSAQVWQEIVMVLGRIKQPHLMNQATDILLDMLLELHPALEINNIKSTIALALGQLGQIDAIEPLIFLLSTADAQVRLHTIAALKNISSEVAGHKLQQLRDNGNLTSDLQQGIAIALTEW